MTINDHITRKNPFFKNPERPVYELGTLLRQLPYGLTPSEMTPETRLIAAAIQKHAANSGAALTFSIQSLGELMTIAAQNEQASIPSDCAMNVAFLFQNLGSESQYMREIEDQMRWLLGPDPEMAKELYERVSGAA